MPTRIEYGINSINNIDQYINGRKTLLITSHGFIKRGLVKNILSLTDHIVEVVTDVKSHPDLNDLEKVYNRIKKIDFELILAIGGGSVLDAAKFFSVYNTEKEFEFVDGIVRGTIPNENYNKTPIISVPTTAGTGSEITPWATVWDMSKKKKYSLHLPDLFSEVAIYDPMLTISVPKDITIQTGLDALSHSLESIWNKNASPITVNYAIESAKLIIDNLSILVEDLNNIDLRANLMRSCMFAGLAFSNTQTAIAHAMSYYITTHKGIEHGIACSFTLPLLIDTVIGKHSFIDKALIDIFGSLSSNKLRNLYKALNISTDFSHYGINAAEYINLVNSLSSTSRIQNSLINIDEII